MRFRPLGLLGPMRRLSGTWRRNWHRLGTLSTHAMPLLQPLLLWWSLLKILGIITSHCFSHFLNDYFSNIKSLALGENVTSSPLQICSFIHESTFLFTTELQFASSPTNFLSHRTQIGDTTDTLNRLEGDLTIVQDSNSEASKELSALEREAKELNLTSEQLHRQLDILKNSNFLGETECCL